MRCCFRVVRCQSLKYPILWNRKNITTSIQAVAHTTVLVACLEPYSIGLFWELCHILSHFLSRSSSLLSSPLHSTLLRCTHSLTPKVNRSKGTCPSRICRRIVRFCRCSSLRCRIPTTFPSAAEPGACNQQPSGDPKSCSLLRWVQAKACANQQSFWIWSSGFGDSIFFGRISQQNCWLVDILNTSTLTMPRTRSWLGSYLLISQCQLRWRPPGILSNKDSNTVAERRSPLVNGCL